MWEGLARTQRQDRVLHGAAKLANLLFGVLALPLWLLGQLVARMLEQAAQNEIVRVWILAAGRHGVLEAIDPTWTYGVYRAFFERWGIYAERPAPRGASAEVVYSAADTGKAEVK